MFIYIYIYIYIYIGVEGRDTIISDKSDYEEKEEFKRVTNTDMIDDCIVLDQSPTPRPESPVGGGDQGGGGQKHWVKGKILYIYMYVYTYLCICMHVYMYIYIYIHICI
jgi:hypothetical protein